MIKNLKSEKGASIWKVILIIVLVLFLLFLIVGSIIGYFVYKKVEKATVEEVGNQVNIFYNEVEERESNTIVHKETKTNEEMDDENWKVYQNEKYNYTFEYPKNWEMGQNMDDYVVLLDNANQLTFEFRSDVMTAFGLEGYDLVEKKNISVGGVDGEEYYLASPGGGNMAYVKFKKDGKDHLLAIYYSDDYELAEDYFDKVVESISFTLLKTKDK